MQYLRITLRGHNHRSIVIQEKESLGPDYSVIDDASTQNGIRYMIGVLNRMPCGYDGSGHPCYAVNGTYDLAVTYDAYRKCYRLWTYTRNWPSRCGWYAGMIHAEKVRKMRKAKRRKVAA